MLVESYQAWIIHSCGYVGDGWWVRRDNYHEFFCPKCETLVKDATVDKRLLEEYARGL